MHKCVPNGLPRGEARLFFNDEGGEGGNARDTHVLTERETGGGRLMMAAQVRAAGLPAGGGGNRGFPDIAIPPPQAPPSVLSDYPKVV